MTTHRHPERTREGSGLGAHAGFSLELASAYLAAGARVASWAVVSAVVWRRLGPDAFAVLVLVRGTLTLLNYAGFGLAPAMIRLKAQWDQERRPAATGLPATGTETPGRLDLEPPTADFTTVQTGPPVPAPSLVRLSSTSDADSTPSPSMPVVAPAAVQGGPDPLSVALLRNGTVVSLRTLLAAILIGGIYALFVRRVHAIPGFLGSDAAMLAELIAVGCALRLASDSAGAILQTHGRIAADNVAQAVSEILWVAGCFVAVLSAADFLQGIGVAFAVASFMLFAVRFRLAHGIAPQTPEAHSTEAVSWLLKYGLIVTAGSLADFLYGPLACILINRLLTDSDLAAYSAAIQIDGALLLLVTGLAAVLLPRAAAAVGRHDWRAVRRSYLRGTGAATGMLTIAALATWLLSPLLFRAWLKNPPALATAILPLVLMHTIVGGQSQIGRSILLALGKARALTASLLAGGVANALICLLLVNYTSLGIKAVPLATLLVVTLRGAVWTPWYVLATIRTKNRRLIS